MKNTENKKPIFELGFSTQLLNEIERKRALIKLSIKKKLDVIDKSEHLSYKDKMSKILNFSRFELYASRNLKNNGLQRNFK